MVIKCPCCKAKLHIKIEYHAVDKTAVNRIVKICASHFAIAEGNMYKKSQQNTMIPFRFTAMYFLKKYENLTHKEIGNCFGLHRTSAVNALGRVDAAIQAKDWIYNDLIKLEKKIARLYEVPVPSR